MRILFLSTWFPYPPDNGSKLRAYYLAQSLAVRHDVTVVAFRPHSDAASRTGDAFDVKLSVVAVPDDPFRYVKLPKWAKYISLSPVAFRSSPVMQHAVADQAGSGPWDVVVAMQVPVAQYARSVRARCRIIDVDTAMSFQMYDRFRHETRTLVRASHWISWQKAHRYERDVLRHFHAATVVWQAEAAFLRQMVRHNTCPVTVITNGVDCVRNWPGFVAPQPNTLVYNGSLTYSANFDAMRWFLADIYPLIKVAQPDIRLTITGSTQGVDLSQLSLDDSVQLTGHVADVRLPVAGAALCVVPLRQGGGTRLKILEAMALGTPIISTTKGAEGLDVAGGEHLLLADTPREFAHAVLSLLADAQLHAQLAANGRRLVEDRYDWARVGQHFVALVENTVRGRSRPMLDKQSISWGNYSSGGEN